MPALQRCISKTSPFRRLFASAGFALALLASLPVAAQRTYESRELYMLPVYCRYTQDFNIKVPGGNDPAEKQRWATLMGPTFIHMHHYCWGLMASNRAAFFSDTRQDRLHNLGVSITEFDYVIQRSPQDFSMLPEILTKKGESLIGLDRAGEGMLEFQHAIKLKAGYGPAYAAMSDYYKETGQLARAREWLEKGLAAAPDAKVLKQRLAELDAPRGKRKNDLRPPAER